MRICSIEMKITLEDGEVVEASMSAEYGDQRWGSDLEHLAACVQPMADMAQALSDNSHWSDESEENT